MKTSGSLLQHYRDETALDNDSNITNFPSNNALFKSKIKITWKPLADGNTKNAKIAAPLKHFSNFWRTLEMLLINCEINLISTWSKKLCYFSKNLGNKI